MASQAKGTKQGTMRASEAGLEEIASTAETITALIERARRHNLAVECLEAALRQAEQIIGGREEPAHRSGEATVNATWSALPCGTTANRTLSRVSGRALGRGEEQPQHVGNHG